MTLKSHFTSLKKLIDKGLDRYLPSAKEEPKTIHRAMRYSVFSGGKRIRPVIVLEACKACGGETGDAIAAACAVELVHTYSLIHDDLPSMDDDDYRRGKPTCHKVFGEANAILAGDALLTLAFGIIASSFGPKTAVDIIKELSAAAGTKGMVGGQALDIECRDKKIQKGLLRHINRLKTAKLFKASAKIGAIAAGAGAKKIKASGEYGLNLGIAFQLTDDIIDKDGAVKTTGASAVFRQAQNSAGKASRALDSFGKHADGLKKIVDSVLSRIS